MRHGGMTNDFIKKNFLKHNTMYVMSILFMLLFSNSGPQHFCARQNLPTGGAECWSSGPSGGVSAL